MRYVCSSATGDAQCKLELADGSLCTPTEKCKQETGTCSGGECKAADLNTSDGNECTVDSCNKLTGEITHTPKPGINDSDACTVDSCDPKTGKIAHTPSPEIDDGNKCTNDSCDKNTGLITHTPRPGIDDGNLCTVDSCDPKTGKIAHTLVSTTDNNKCTDDSCDPKTGAVSHVPVKSLDDNNPCTLDLCSPLTGTVTHSPLLPSQLDDGNPCTADACNKKTGITHTPLAEGATCDDGSACTSQDHCNGAGACIGISELTQACGFAPPDPPNTSFKPDLSPEPTKEFGTIAGRFSVSASGAAQYALPFAVPPGRGQMAPSLGLSYSSDQGNSVVGMGFGLTGLSSVTRCSKAMEPDGVVREVMYDAYDNFCLDGARLVRVGPGEYRTVPDSFSRITTHAADGIVGPARFKVETKDGRILFFGSAPGEPTNGASAFAANGTVREWLVHTIQDRHNNKIQFFYGGIDKTIPVQGVSYSAERVLNTVKYPPNNRIEFSYEVRPDQEVFYTKGMALELTQRLTSVEAFAGEKSVRRYFLSYEGAEGHASGRSRLEKIQECTGSDETLPMACKPSTNFTWNGGVAGFQEAGQVGGGGPKLIDALLSVGDWNGDGLHETMFFDTYRVQRRLDEIGKDSFGDWFYADADHLSYETSINSGGFLSPVLPIFTGDPYSLFYLLEGKGATEFPLQLPRPVVFDYDGDGKDDLIFSSFTFTPGKLVVLKSKGSTFDWNTSPVNIPTTPLIPIPFLRSPDPLPPPDPKTVGSLHFGDINGDGLQDMLMCYPPSTDTAGQPVPAHWVLHPHVGNGYKDEAAVVAHDLLGTPCDATVFNFDQNGDGKQEFVFEPGFTTDVDGNSLFFGYRSLSLVAGVNRLGQFSTSLRLDTTPGIPDFYAYEADGPSNYARVVLDVNGDGLQDIVSTTNGGKKLLTYINTGAGFLPPVYSLGEFLDRDTYPSHLRMAIPVEWNGDGKTDLLIPSEEFAFWDVLYSQPGTNEWKRRLHVLDMYRPLGVEDPTNPPGWVQHQAQKATDLNGDGVADLLGVKDQKLFGALSTLSEEDTLRTIDEGTRPREAGEPEHVPTVEIVYGHLNEETNTPLYPRTSVSRAHRVVKTYKLNNGLASNKIAERTNAFHLSYSDGVYDRLGHRFLGFQERTISQEFPPNEQKAVFVRERYGKIQEKASGIEGFYPYIGFLTQKTVTVSDETMYRQTEDIFSPSVKVSSTGTFFVYSSSAIHNVYDGFPNSSNVSMRVTETIEVDSFGNTTLKESFSPLAYPSTSPASGYRRQEKTTYKNDVANWVIGRPLVATYCETSSSYPVADGCGTSQFTHTALGDLESVITDPDRPASWLRTFFHRDTFGNIVGATSQDYKNTTRSSWIFFDEQGHFPYARVNSLGHVQFEKYDPSFGVLTQAVDPNGLVSRRSYDRFGRLSSEEAPDGVRLTIEQERVRDQSNEIVTRTRTYSSEGQDNVTLANSIGNVQKSVSKGFQGKLFSEEFDYDRFGRRVSQSVPSESEFSKLYVKYEYDLVGRLVKTIAPDGGVSEVDYKTPRQVSVKNPKNYTTTQFYDSSGRIVLVKDALQGETSYQHGAFGTSKATPPIGKPSSQVLDWRGKLVSQQDPDRGESTFGYNAFGELVRETNALHTASFEYDALGRPTKRTSGNEVSTWAWDSAPHGVGQLARTVSADNHKEAFEYDALGRIRASHFYPRGEAEQGAPYTTRFEYETAPGKGRLRRLRYPHGDEEPDLSIRYEYDDQGLMTAIFREGGIGRPQPLWRWNEADVQGHPTLETFGNGLQTVRSYNLASGLLEHTQTGPDQSSTPQGSPFQSLSYEHDDNHNLKTREDLLRGLKETVVYDPLDRVKNVILTGPLGFETKTSTFDYDAAGNILSRSSGSGPPKIWEYDPAHPHAVTKAFRDGTTYNFKYDDLGRQVKRGSTSFGYTSFNKPKTFKVGNRLAATFTYDSLQNRVSKETLTGDTLYIHQLYERFSDARTGDVTLKYMVYNQEGVVAVVRHQSEPVSSRQAWTSSTLYLHPDILGSPTLITNQDGEVESRLSYDVFGKPRSAADWWSPAEGTSEALQLSGYTGHDDDVDLGLVNMRGRIYDPNIARFLTPDPVVQAPFFSQSWNRYSYVFNNPLSLVDPSGFSAKPVPSPPPELPPVEEGKEVKKEYSDGPTKVRVTGPRDPAAADPFKGKAGAGEERMSPRMLSGATNNSSGGYLIDDFESKFLRHGNQVALGVAIASTAPLLITQAPGAIASAGVAAARLWPWLVPLAEVARRNADKIMDVMNRAWAPVARLGSQAGQFVQRSISNFCQAGRCWINGSCFAAGTLVWTKHGAKNIEEVKVGDAVLSRDEATGELSWQPVTRVFVTPDKDLLELAFSAGAGDVEILFVTPEHPFWTKDAGWVPAGELRAGDHVATADAGGWVEVQSLRGPPAVQTVYNLEVATTHTYFVGRLQLWVHNNCGLNLLNVTDKKEATFGVLRLSGGKADIALARRDLQQYPMHSFVSQALGPRSGFDDRRIGLFLERGKVTFVRESSAGGNSDIKLVLQDVKFIEDALRQHDLIHPQGTLIKLLDGTSVVIKP